MSFDQRPARIRKECWVQSSSQTEREHRLFITKRKTPTEKNAKNLINSSGIPASLRYALKKIFYQTAYTVWIQIHHIQHTFHRVLTQVPDNIYFCFTCGKKKKRELQKIVRCYTASLCKARQCMLQLLHGVWISWSHFFLESCEHKEPQPLSETRYEKNMHLLKMKAVNSPLMFLKVEEGSQTVDWSNFPKTLA